MGVESLITTVVGEVSTGGLQESCEPLVTVPMVVVVVTGAVVVVVVWTAAVVVVVCQRLGRADAGAAVLNMETAGINAAATTVSRLRFVCRMPGLSAGGVGPLRVSRNESGCWGDVSQRAARAHGNPNSQGNLKQYGQQHDETAVPPPNDHRLGHRTVEPTRPARIDCRRCARRLQQRAHQQERSVPPGLRGRRVFWYPFSMQSSVGPARPPITASLPLGTSSRCTCSTAEMSDDRTCRQILRGLPALRPIPKTGLPLSPPGVGPCSVRPGR